MIQGLNDGEGVMNKPIKCCGGNGAVEGFGFNDRVGIANNDDVVFVCSAHGGVAGTSSIEWLMLGVDGNDVNAGQDCGEMINDGVVIAFAFFTIGAIRNGDGDAR